VREVCDEVGSKREPLFINQQPAYAEDTKITQAAIATTIKTSLEKYLCIIVPSPHEKLYKSLIYVFVVKRKRSA
jgi:hypothetical protein